MNTSTMTSEQIQAQARLEAYDTPLDQINVSKPRFFQSDTIWPYFERLRREDPVHYCRASVNGPFWSVTKFKDILTVEGDHQTYSSASGIGISDPPPFLTSGGFISMDPPKHDDQRKTVSPIVAPGNLVNFEKLIRTRVCKTLDELPIDEEFNWVDKVSISLTTQMLATLFDFPFEDRHLLTFWSDAATSEVKGGGVITSEAMRSQVLGECLAYFTKLWNQRVNAEPGSDLISMLAHSPATRNMSPEELLGNLILLIVGGNDTTRNSMTGGLYFLNKNPSEFQKVRDNPALIPNMVSEIIRYQTPLAHMRRTALKDTELAGKQIKKGDKVVMWYLSGNRDEEAIDQPNQFIIDRPRARQHLSFGFGIHRCVGNRLAELQLKIMWEEILKRFTQVDVIAEPQRIYSNFVHGYTTLPVRIRSQSVLAR
jgi:cytochrome P450